MVTRAVCILTICLLAWTSAAATPTVTVTRMSGYYSGNGGEFTLTPNDELKHITAETGPFQTFCIEKQEYVGIGGTYDVAVSTEAIGGGINNGPNGPHGGDPLDFMTAWLYAQFRSGALASHGYNYTPGVGRQNSAAALQNAIWYIENEINSLPSGLATTFYNAAVAAKPQNIGNVRVLNLYAQGHLGDKCYAKQDQLVLVPAPGAILLGGIGITLVGWLRRRRTL